MIHGLSMQVETEKTKKADKKVVKRLFPCTVQNWLKDLPLDLLLKLGEPTFKKEITRYYTEEVCWHRVELTNNTCNGCNKGLRVDNARWKGFADQFDKTINSLKHENLLNFERMYANNKEMVWAILCLDEEARINWEENFADLTDVGVKNMYESDVLPSSERK